MGKGLGKVSDAVVAAAEGKSIIDTLTMAWDALGKGLNGMPEAKDAAMKASLLIGSTLDPTLTTGAFCLAYCLLRRVMEREKGNSSPTERAQLKRDLDALHASLSTLQAEARSEAESRSAEVARVRESVAVLYRSAARREDLNAMWERLNGLEETLTGAVFTAEAGQEILNRLDAIGTDRLTLANVATELRSGLEGLTVRVANLETQVEGHRERIVELERVVAERLVVLREHPTPGPLWFGVPSVTRRFVGRERELADLHFKLQHTNTSGLTLALIGGGGIGKSTLAAAYARVFRSDYEAVVWLRGDTESSLRDSLASLAGHIEPGLSAAELDARVAFAMRWLADKTRVLVVLDDLDQASALALTVAGLPGVWALVTTRRSDLPESFMSCEVGLLDSESSVALLLSSAGADPARVSRDERATAAEFAARLGRLPLVLDQVGIYAQALRIGVSELAEEWDGLIQHALETYPPMPGRHDSLWSTVALSYEQAEREGAGGAEFTRAMAWLDSDFTHTEAFEHRPDAWPQALKAALRSAAGKHRLYAALERVALVRRVDKVVIQPDGQEVGRGWAMHRSFQDALRQGAAAEDGWWVHEAILASWNTGEMDSKPAWSRMRRCLDAARTLAFRRIEGATGTLANQVGVFLMNVVHDLDGALTAFNEAERIDRSVFGDDHPEVARDVNNRGYVLKASSDFPGALAAFREAERIDRAALGDDHPSVAIRVNNVGSVLQAQGDLDGALAAFREAERIDRATFGNDHPSVAIRVNNVGSVLQAKGDLDEALAAFHEAERIDRATYGDDHPSVAIRVNNVGSVLQAKGDLDGALAAFRVAERIDRATFGDDHPEVASDVNNVGGVLQAQGDLDGALEAFREAERIDRATFGDDHPTVARDVNNVGSVLQAKGDFEQALACYAPAFRTVLRVNGPRGRNVIATALNVLAVGGDPVAIARELGGDTAGEFISALQEASAGR